jgi:zinc protease
MMKKRWIMIGGGVVTGLALALLFLTQYEGGMGSMIYKKVDFDIPIENVKKVVLDNGMSVIVFQNKHVPKVLVQMAYDVGSGIEKQGERGLAHLIEHMIFKGTKKLAEGDIDSIARKYGASFNAFTGYDVTSYYFETNSSNWQPFVGILADCMQNSRFEEEHLASELKTVIQEMRMQRDDFTWVMFDKALGSLYPSNHPYQHSIIGFKEDLVNLKANDLRSFYKRYYHPGKATLFIVGDVDTDEAISLAKEHFGSIPGPTEEQKKIGTPLFPRSFEFATSENTVFENVAKEQLCCYWRIPGQKELGEEIPTVVAGVLGEGEGSILYKRLVDEEQVAISVGVGPYQFFGDGILCIIIDPKDGCAEKCKAIVKEELSKIIKEGVPDFALSKIVRAEERAFLKLFENMRSLTYQWIQSYFTTKKELEIFTFLKKLQDVDSSAVQVFIARHLDPFLMNSVRILPLPEKKKELWKEKKQISDQLDAEILKNHQRTAPLEDPSFVKNLSDPQPIDFSFPKPTKTITLSNGLTVLLHKDKFVPLMYVRCAFKDASILGQSLDGIDLGLMMNMLVEGSEGFSKKDNVDFFEGMGAMYDYGKTGGTVSMTNSSYEEILKRFFHVLMKPKFDEEALKKLKSILIDAFQRSKDNPRDVGIRLFKNIVYANHPFEWTFDQAIKKLSSLSLNDLKKIHEEYVSPSRMIVSIAGDFDLDEMQDALEKATSKWEGKSYRSAALSESTFVADTKIDEKMLRDQGVLILGQSSPITVAHPDIVPLKMLSFIAFDSLGSHLYELRERTGLFYMAGGAWAHNISKEHGFDYVIALLNIENLEKAEVGIRDMIKKIASDGVTEEELSDARQWYLKQLLDASSSNAAKAQILGWEEEMGVGFSYYDELLKKANSITLEEVNAAARKYFDESKFARVRVGRV